MEPTITGNSTTIEMEQERERAGSYSDTYGDPLRAERVKEQMAQRESQRALDAKYPNVKPLDYARATALGPNARHVCDDSFICDLSPVEDADALPKWLKLVRADPEEYEREVFRKFRRLDCPSDAYHFLKGRFLREEVEVFVVVCLDVANNVLCVQELARGSDDQVMANTKDIFRAAVAKGAHAIVVAHNHPSGTPEPSDADIRVSKRVAMAGQVLGIPLADHIVISPNGYTSMADRGII